MVKNLIMLYPNLCYNETCYKGTTLYIHVSLKNSSTRTGYELKAVFSEENYVPLFPQLQIESASMFTKIIISSLLCQNDTIYIEWLESINYFKGEQSEHAQTQFAMFDMAF